MPLRSLVGPQRSVWAMMGILAITLLGVSCGSPAPAVADVEPSAGVVVGVAWFDDGNGRIDRGEEAASDLTVRLGQGGMSGTAVFDDSAIQTDERGGFATAVPEVIAGLGQDLFVEVEVLTEGPGGAPSIYHHRVGVIDVNSPVEVPLRRAEACVVSLEQALGDSSRCGAVRLPDLVPITDGVRVDSDTQPVGSASAYVDTTTNPGRVLLRFASATANLGTGPLHMIPDASPAGQRIGTWQRLWTDENRFIDHRTGEFVFHEGHDHFHLEAFEQYRLLSLEGEVVRLGEKISFCLLDSLPIDETAQIRGQGIFLDAVCEEAGDQQAINPGWADYYGAGLPDQWIDITGIDPGNYLVEIVVDPENQLIEADETNNQASFMVTVD